MTALENTRQTLIHTSGIYCKHKGNETSRSTYLKLHKTPAESLIKYDSDTRMWEDRKQRTEAEMRIKPSAHSILKH
jgi:hypothetical protein